MMVLIDASHKMHYATKYGDVGVVGFYNRSHVNLSSGGDHTIVHLDRSSILPMLSDAEMTCSSQTVVMLG